MNPQLRLIVDHAHEGIFNIAVDEFLLARHVEEQNENPVLRFYRFSPPAMTVGYGLWPRMGGQLSERAEAIRRITGGGVVMHGSDLVYSFVVPLMLYPALRKPRESYRYLHEALCEALNYVGIEANLFDDCCHSEARRAEESKTQILSAKHRGGPAAPPGGRFAQDGKQGVRA